MFFQSYIFLECYQKARHSIFWCKNWLVNKTVLVKHAKLRSFNRRKLISRLIYIFYRFEIRFACFYFRFIHISTSRPNTGPGNCIRTLVEVPQQERWSLVTGTVSNCYRKSLSLSAIWAIVCRYDIPCFFKHFAAPTSFGVVIRPLMQYVSNGICLL